MKFFLFSLFFAPFALGAPVPKSSSLEFQLKNLDLSGAWELSSSELGNELRFTVLEEKVDHLLSDTKTRIEVQALESVSGIKEGAQKPDFVQLTYEKSDSHYKITLYRSLETTINVVEGGMVRAKKIRLLIKPVSFQVEKISDNSLTLKPLSKDAPEGDVILKKRTKTFGENLPKIEWLQNGNTPELKDLRLIVVDDRFDGVIRYEIATITSHSATLVAYHILLALEPQDVEAQVDKVKNLTTYSVKLREKKVLLGTVQKSALKASLGAQDLLSSEDYGTAYEINIDKAWQVVENPKFKETKNEKKRFLLKFKDTAK